MNNIDLYNTHEYHLATEAIKHSIKNLRLQHILIVLIDYGGPGLYPMTSSATHYILDKPVIPKKFTIITRISLFSDNIGIYNTPSFKSMIMEDMRYITSLISIVFQILC